MKKRQESRIKNDFGSRLRAIRIAKRLSQEALALVCDLDRTYIGGIERGERNVSLLNIYKIAHALRISPRELFPSQSTHLPDHRFGDKKV